MEQFCHAEGSDQKSELRIANSEFRIEKKGGGFSILNSAFAIRNYLATLGITALLHASNPMNSGSFLEAAQRRRRVRSAGSE
jgi:hypothetical protein